MDYPVILVGHSMNGVLISQVGEQIPEKIERLVYVTAFLLKNSGSVYEAMEGDAENGAFPEIRFSDDQAFATLPEAALRRIGLYDVDDSGIQRILPLMAEWQATGPFLTKVELSDDNFGSVPKTYVRTSIDKMISPALQDTMIANWAVDPCSIWSPVTSRRPQCRASWQTCCFEPRRLNPRNSSAVSEESVTENRTVENIEGLFKAAKENGISVFISPH